ncbi:hypothetical protein HK100_007785 [Physocladia obscura]|uniref:TIR domain-containing protein n=1 Tax=Physocladia obscura TaxID=109957 RepID=A0AAD5XKK7_9FUNG|nr:hypothetical protein HK100_007785 [Physocladia obscura]
MILSNQVANADDLADGLNKGNRLPFSSPTFGWKCIRDEVMHDVYISSKSSDRSLAYHIASSIETSSKCKYHVFTDWTCHNMGSNDLEYLNEVLPRSKLFVILISVVMIEEFKTAHQRVCYPLLELERAMDLGSRLAIIPVFLDNSQDLLKNSTFDDYPNDIHKSDLSPQKEKVRNIVSSISQREGYTFKSKVSESKKGDLDGLVRNLVSDLENHLQNNLRWNMLLPTKPKFDVLIRDNSEQDLATALYYVLSAERQLVRDINRGLEVFLDEKCLKKGADWKVEFLNGIRASAIFIFLISEAALEKFRTADKFPDDLLLGLESAFDILDHRKRRSILILPVFVDGFFPQSDDFDDQFHCHPSSPRMLTIKTVIKRISQLQGLKLYTEKNGSNFQAAESIVPAIMTYLKERWAEQQKRADALMYPEIFSFEGRDKDDEIDEESI